jgi:hypothetical protein
MGRRTGLQTTADDLEWLGKIHSAQAGGADATGGQAKALPEYSKSKLIALGLVETRAGILVVTQKGQDRLGQK